MPSPIDAENDVAHEGLVGMSAEGTTPHHHVVAKPTMTMLARDEHDAIGRQAAPPARSGLPSPLTSFSLELSKKSS